MAKPISDTPVLRGEDAKRFLEAMTKPRDQEAVKKERDRVLRNYNLIKNSTPVDKQTASK